MARLELLLKNQVEVPDLREGVPSTFPSFLELGGRRGQMWSRATFKAGVGFGFLVALKLSHSVAWDLRAQGPSPETQAERGQWLGDSGPPLGSVESGEVSGALGAGGWSGISMNLGTW